MSITAETPRISAHAGRRRAQRLYPSPLPCQRCGASERIERHHCDGNPNNNEATNIRFLCRRCHMVEDGRLARMPELARMQRRVKG